MSENQPTIPQISLRNNHDRGKLAIVSLYVMIGVYVVNTIINVYATLLVHSFMNGRTISIQEYNTYEMVETGITVIVSIGTIFCAIVFIQWFRRAYFNLHKLKKGLHYSEGWAAGGWFVPIMNLFAPYNIASDLVKHTETILTKRDLIEKKPRRHQVLGWWWATWILSGLLYRIGNNFATINGLYILIISSVLAIICGVLAVALIRDYMMMEKELSKMDQIRTDFSNGSGTEKLLDSEL